MSSAAGTCLSLARRTRTSTVELLGSTPHFMTTLSQLLRPLPAARRAYSVFSKPGGGRYFNSAKPPKVSPGSGKGKVDVSNTSGDAVSTKDQSSSQQHGAQIVAEGLTSPIRSASATPIHPVHAYRANIRISILDHTLFQNYQGLQEDFPRGGQ